MVAVFSPGQQALPLSYLVSALMLDDEAEAAELCALYSLPLEEQRGASVAVINKARLLLSVMRCMYKYTIVYQVYVLSNPLTPQSSAHGGRHECRSSMSLRTSILDPCCLHVPGTMTACRCTCV